MFMNYITIFGQLLVMLVIFLATKYFTFQLTEVWGLPRWLNYKPWNCAMCSCFWSLVAIYTTIWIMGYWWTGIGGLILAILNGVAMYIDQRKKTVDVNQYHVDDNNEN